MRRREPYRAQNMPTWVKAVLYGAFGSILSYGTIMQMTCKEAQGSEAEQRITERNGSKQISVLTMLSAGSEETMQ